MMLIAQLIYKKPVVSFNKIIQAVLCKLMHGYILLFEISYGTRSNEQNKFIFQKLEKS